MVGLFFLSLVRFGQRNTLTRHGYSNHKIGAGRPESMLNTDSGGPYYVESGHFSRGSCKVDLRILQEPFAPLEHILSHLLIRSAYILFSKVIPEGVTEVGKLEAPTKPIEA